MTRPDGPSMSVSVGAIPVSSVGGKAVLPNAAAAPFAAPAPPRSPFAAPISRPVPPVAVPQSPAKPAQKESTQELVAFGLTAAGAVMGAASQFLPWTGVFSTIPFDHHGAKVTIDVLLNAERTRAIIDTGNNLSFVSLSASALWGAATNDLAPTRLRAQSPLNNGAPMPVSAYPFTQVKIGDDLFHDKKMGVVDANLKLASANLGLDYWSSRKMWISYLHQWLFVADDPSAVKLAYPIETAPAVAVGATPTQIAGPN